MASSPQSPRIAIIGAGPAGLTLARLLHVSEANVDFTVYERDASATSRLDLGGCLDLHTDTGLLAIRKCRLWDAFQNFARYEGEELIMADKNATELVHAKGGDRDRPEIDRWQLKQMLVDSVPADRVRWGRKLKQVTEHGMLKFEGQEEADGPFDLIVGADGAWSKVRMRLNGLVPTYAGVSGYEMDIKKPEETCPQVNKRVGRGAFFSSSDRKMLNAQRLADDSLKVRSWFLCPEGEAQNNLEKFGKEKTLDGIFERYAGWAPEITDFFKQGDVDTLRHWTLYELPVGCKWEHKRGFTLIGDAASLMTPFGGEGVNKAMRDSLELAELIEKSHDPNELTLDQAVLRYEQAMFPRAEKFQAMTMNYKELSFGPDAPLGLFPGMIKVMASDNPSILMKVVSSAPALALIWTYFWARQMIGLAVRRYWRKT